ncbi:5-methyltetrahydropteroyltriglutamate--homocysteine methyltransferase [Methylopila jiangsuensis]|uniref:5-methyltetrahydropteroyltriglutamate--homocysteine methyltransferase n=1 Tax=Methylopila jiangsuensis TaxID=586230 RepID=A0A9W6JES3_9HYPH|nr:5-methyltetrahydropteroyltriglutamate--homocysteine S-methyltransferase [Methylopila jiangsuensis]MDR6284223.1 5-methyltetrahydropteroyltriglutamate--homocysteine methyltransferase [Methylopila jiangsuensis]GLK76260.1 5-methyltetrahydropteroyltriglutamate--homocysteine methyltransferase [Methylopila jiangsuensis]
MSNSEKTDIIRVATLGAPRIGPRRELKTALESYWSGKSDAATLETAAAGLRAANWARQKARGVAVIPSNDFSLYDHVLDVSAMAGVVPERYGWSGGPVPLDAYFAMARGRQGGEAHGACGCGHAGAAALEMTKWFDTNYHYMVPEFSRAQRFALSSTKVVSEFCEALALGHKTRPVLVGPVTYLRLGKSADAGFDPIALIDDLLPVYVEVLKRLAAHGADWAQLDEPCLALDLDAAARKALADAYARFAREVPSLKIMLATYFGGLGDNLGTALALPVAGLHLDLVRAPTQLDLAVARAPKDLTLSLGVIDGRNVWRADLAPIVERLAPVVAARGAERIELAPSCSLLHTPVDLASEDALDPDVKRWLAFSVQKMEELSILARALSHGADSVKPELTSSSIAARARRESPKIHDPEVAMRLARVTPDMTRRRSAFAERAVKQRKGLDLPAYPTTTIGSFPQTPEVRKARAANANGALPDADYVDFLRKVTASAIRWQEEIGLDVLAHGEFERNDMVQYFGEQLAGFAFTRHGWVQSYGSRCVRPPILYGDVSRPKPMTVEWWSYSQSLTSKPMKGMLTGPVTILNWSFVRDDIPRATACRQIALAIRDEVEDLEAAGASVIQIDEAALREGLPLRRGEWKTYLDWAVASFRLCSSGVEDATQIHTHMCYSEFNDIIASIGAMDADVISIETSRSRMELLDAFVGYRYPAEIGPGVYDIHSPRVPSVEEMVELLERARERIAPEQLWVNPDCGLKTRKWEEVKPALVNMVAAARRLRDRAASAEAAQ